jgi:multidrug resistance efflux pump
MEFMPTTSPSQRHWRISLPVSLGVILLLASIVIAAMTIRSHTARGNGTSPPVEPNTPAEGNRWMCLGSVDVEGGVTPIYPLQPGRVKSVEAVENEAIKAGQPLIHLEDTTQTQKVKEAEAAVKAAKKQAVIAQAKVDQADEQIQAQQVAIEAAQLQVKQAQKRVDREREWAPNSEALKSYEIDVQRAEKQVNGEQRKLAIAKAAKREAEGMVALAQANIEGKQALLGEAQNAVKETVVRAPCDGTPLRILVSVGQTLGNNPHQPAIQFAADKPLLVRADVEQEFVNRVKKGQVVIIEENSRGQEVARGKVVSLARWYAPRRSASPEALQVNNDNRTLECIIKIESYSQELRIGERVRVQFPN